jgi:predicted transcriptional regulator
MSAYNKELTTRVNKGNIKAAEKGIVLTPETFSKVFSPERIKLLKRIYKNNVKNIYQLAKELNKPYEVVFRNIKYLEGLGLIEIKDVDNTKIPHISQPFIIDFFTSENAMT